MDILSLFAKGAASAAAAVALIFSGAGHANTGGSPTRPSFLGYDHGPAIVPVTGLASTSTTTLPQKPSFAATTTDRRGSTTSAHSLPPPPRLGTTSASNLPPRASSTINAQAPAPWHTVLMRFFQKVPQN